MLHEEGGEVGRQNGRCAQLAAGSFVRKKFAPHWCSSHACTLIRTKAARDRERIRALGEWVRVEDSGGFSHVYVPTRRAATVESLWMGGEARRPPPQRDQTERGASL